MTATITMMYQVQTLIGKDWINACQCATQEQAEFWINEFKKVGTTARWLDSKSLIAKSAEEKKEQ